eukprot:3849582-Rhodomonas_salina.1
MAAALLCQSSPARRTPPPQHSHGTCQTRACMCQTRVLMCQAREWMTTQELPTAHACVLLWYSLLGQRWNS